MSAKVLAPSRTKVLFSAPIEVELIRPKPLERGHDWTHLQIQAHVDLIKTAGFGEGAIVVHRKNSMHERRTPRNWGVVMNLQRYRGSHIAPYTPLTVKCFLDNSLWYGWHEDLLLVNRAYEWQELEAIFRPQLET